LEQQQQSALAEVLQRNSVWLQPNVAEAEEAILLTEAEAAREALAVLHLKVEAI
jgi:thiazole synthase ThiGH ThiG subunit